MTVFRVMAVALASAVLAACSAMQMYESEGATKLSGRPLKDFVEATTLEVKNPQGQDLQAYLGVGGPAWAKLGENKDTGTWKLSADSNWVCITWKELREGKENCYALLRKGESVRLYNAAGDAIYTGTFKKGDVHRLAG
jgi:hypothetical protein